jgi:hypothetical protein
MSDNFDIEGHLTFCYKFYIEGTNFDIVVDIEGYLQYRRSDIRHRGRKEATATQVQQQDARMQVGSHDGHPAAAKRSPEPALSGSMLPLQSRRQTKHLLQTSDACRKP